MLTLTLVPNQPVMALNTHREGIIESLPVPANEVLYYDVPLMIKFNDGQRGLVRPSHLADIHK